MPTQQCNCCCPYCYLPKEEREKKGEPAFFHTVVEEFISTAEESGRMDTVPQLRILGGEPYLEITTVAALCNRFSGHFSPCLTVINTNGTLITRENLGLFSHPESTCHIVSLDGPEPVHNARRIMKNGANAYRSAVAGIRTLKDLGFPVYLNLVLDDSNLPALGETMDLLRNDFGIDALSISLRHSRHHAPDTAARFELLRAAYTRAAQKGIAISGHHRLLLGKMIPALRCQAGRKTVLVTSDGRLSACQRFVGTDCESSVVSELADFRTLRMGTRVDEECYTRETDELGERLYRMYQTDYPEYLTVSRLDRILFGVI